VPKDRGQYTQILRHANELYETKLGPAILDGSLPRKRLQLLAKEVYLQEKWPSHIARVYLSLDEEALANRRIVNYILSIIRAENLGLGSRGISHTELARRFAFATALSEKALSSANPTPANRMLMDWCDMSALDRPWLESLAVHIACESQAKTMRMVARGLQINYGFSAQDVQFWAIHGGRLERLHMCEGLSILAEYASPKNFASVEYAYNTSCRLVSNFYDSILEE